MEWMFVSVIWVAVVSVVVVVCMVVVQMFGNLIVAKCWRVRLLRIFL